MKRKIISALLAAMVLLLSGCGSFLHREYSVVEPHSSDYYENEDVLRAESYQDVVNDLLILVGEQKKEGTIWLYLKDTTTDVAELAERACREVQRETPLGAYAVDYLTYTIDRTPRNYVAVALTIGYRRSAAQMDAIVHTTSISALPDLLTAAAGNEASELTVQVSYFDDQEQEVRAMVADVQRSFAAAEDPWQVNFYPEGSNAGIVEIILKK
jgi:outer membrane lipopolysaccharide assembly protein LptE/RlpB